VLITVIQMQLLTFKDFKGCMILKKNVICDNLLNNGICNIKL